MTSIAPSLADLESLLERAERDLVRAEMLDAPVRRTAEVASCKARVDEIKAQIGTIEGWTPWGGGMCPVPPGTPIEIKMRASPDEADPSKRPERLRWSHFETTLGSGDIVAYRRAQP